MSVHNNLSLCLGYFQVCTLMSFLLSHLSHQSDGPLDYYGKVDPWDPRGEWLMNSGRSGPGGAVCDGSITNSSEQRCSNRDENIELDSETARKEENAPF